MNWLQTRWSLALLMAITMTVVLVHGQYHSLLFSHFWNPADAESGFHGRLDLYFYGLLVLWLLYGLARGVNLRHRGE